MQGKNNVIVCDNTRVQDIYYKDGQFEIITDKQSYISKVCCGAFGKRSNIDIKWKRGFVQKKPNALNNFIGIKYHAELDHPRDQIALHNFKDGYCGISPIEDDKTCICYLTTAHNLRNNGSNIHLLEKEVLFKNPFIHEAFARAKFLYDKPLSISQISFDKKQQVENHVLFLGDAAGLITPLCGNGMSMALHSSRIASGLITQFLKREISREALERQYTKNWQAEFANRLFAGRMIQSLFGNELLTNVAIRMLRHFPGILSSIIRQTSRIGCYLKPFNFFRCFFF